MGMSWYHEGYAAHPRYEDVALRALGGALWLDYTNGRMPFPHYEGFCYAAHPNLKSAAGTIFYMKAIGFDTSRVDGTEFRK